MSLGIALIEKAGNQSLADLNRFLSLIGSQDDRAAVLSLATFIEDTLGRLLIAYFRNCKETQDLVEGFSAPLGTLGARVKAGYSFGLLTRDQYKDIEILRKIRNEFAHNWEGVSFERQDIRARLKELSCYTLDGKPIEGGSREKLVGTLAVCCIELQVFLGRLESLKVDKAPDVSHRLATTPYKGPAMRRFVE